MQFLPVLQEGFHQGKQVGGLERLRHIGIRAYTQALDLILHSYLGRDQDNGDVAQLEVSLDRLAQVVAAHARHDDIAQDEVGNFILHALQGR